ncbi:MAG: hypothetical protein CM1200mP35_07780 [Chloroflexota bacterium]|nr:MAG: hypothetical protein CM1200mP35_07780 [Chloroflexota bacterium]
MEAVDPVRTKGLSSFVMNADFLGIGCSDAHLASHICTCMTEFDGLINNENELVEGLLGGSFKTSSTRGNKGREL